MNLSKLINKVILNSIQYIAQNKYWTILSDKQIDEMYDLYYKEMYDKIYNIVTTNTAFTKLTEKELEKSLIEIANKASNWIVRKIKIEKNKE